MKLIEFPNFEEVIRTESIENLPNSSLGGNLHMLIEILD